MVFETWWYMGFLEAWFDGVFLQRGFISTGHFGLLSVWHHFELNSQLAGVGNKQVVWIQTETCLSTEFWLQTPQGAFSPCTHSWDHRKTYCLAEFIFFISSSYFHWMNSIYEDLKTSFVLCRNPGFVSETPHPLFLCDSKCQPLLRSSQGGWGRGRSGFSPKFPHMLLG